MPETALSRARRRSAGRGRGACTWWPPPSGTGRRLAAGPGDAALGRLVAAEDTRRTGLLLRHFGIVRPLLSYHAHNRRARLPRLLAALAEGDVALVTDAGTPVVSDPGRTRWPPLPGRGSR